MGEEVKPGEVVWTDGIFEIRYNPKRDYRSNRQFIGYVKVYRSWTRVGESVKLVDLIDRIEKFKERIIINESV